MNTWGFGVATFGIEITVVQLNLSRLLLGRLLVVFFLFACFLFKDKCVLFGIRSPFDENREEYCFCHNREIIIEKP